LGALLYRCLTGKPPFDADSPMQTLQQVLYDEPVPPSRLVPKLPYDLETICLTCLHKQPERRYADAGTLADELRRYAAGEPIHARRGSRAERFVKWARRRPAAAGLLAALALLTLLAGALLVVDYGRRASEKARDAAEQARRDADERRRRAEESKAEEEDQRRQAELRKEKE